MFWTLKNYFMYFIKDSLAAQTGNSRRTHCALYACVKLSQ